MNFVQRGLKETPGGKRSNSSRVRHLRPFLSSPSPLAGDQDVDEGMLSQNDPNRPRPLSSQPKRKWGDEAAAGGSSSPVTFQLTEEDWPPSPKRENRRPAHQSLNIESKPAQTSRVTTTGGGGASGTAAKSNPSFNNNNKAAIQPPKFTPNPTTTYNKSSTSKFIPPLKSNQSRPSSAYSSSSKLAPLFASTSASSSSTSTSTSDTAPKKRRLPWDDISSGTVPNRPSSNFQKFSTPGNTINVDKKELLKNASVNIKQKVILSPEQQIVLKLVVDDGKNVFFTGSAGTGKSVLLREIISSLRLKHRGSIDSVAITASTGMAACNIGGTTIHSFSGIGLGDGNAELLLSRIRKNRNALQRWQRCKVLIVDEVSMVDGYLFDKLAHIANAIKKDGKNKPFGGIQLIVTGDFFQLPPVTKGVANFAFEAKAWKEAIDHTVNLTQVFRQKDTTFIDMLNEMRFGTLSDASVARFKRLNRVPEYNDGIDPTELFPRREDVERANQSRLRSLPGEVTTFQSDDWPPVEPGRTNTYLDNFMAPKKLELKIGAQVMLIKNMNQDLVNGTIGKVIGWGEPEMEFEEGEGDGDYEEDYREDKKPRLIKREREMEDVKPNVGGGGGKKSKDLDPYIEWSTPAGKIKGIVKREKFETEDNKKIVVARRNQYPLILSWAMSIHKSQGQTLPRVKVDLTKVFEKGQSYVALSRATCLEGLQVIGFERSKVLAHPKVTQWSKTLQVLS